MTKVVKAPKEYKKYDVNFRIFLAGSIEMGAAVNWQTKVQNDLKILEKKYKSSEDEELLILNPRREDWDSSWKQSIDDKQFNAQVTWELDGLETADLVVVYFDEKTKSPITLLELGLVAASLETPIIVYCPLKFWRRGNVEMVCDRYGINLVETYDNFIDAINDHIVEFYYDRDK